MEIVQKTAVEINSDEKKRPLKSGTEETRKRQKVSADSDDGEDSPSEEAEGEPINGVTSNGQSEMKNNSVKKNIENYYYFLINT